MKKYRVLAREWIKEDRRLLRHILTLKGWTYRRVAKEIGLEPSSLCRFIGGKAMTGEATWMLRLWLEGWNE